MRDLALIDADALFRTVADDAPVMLWIAASRAVRRADRLRWLVHGRHRGETAPARVGGAAAPAGGARADGARGRARQPRPRAARRARPDADRDQTRARTHGQRASQRP